VNPRQPPETGGVRWSGRANSPPVACPSTAFTVKTKFRDHGRNPFRRGHVLLYEVSAE